MKRKMISVLSIGLVLMMSLGIATFNMPFYPSGAESETEASRVVTVSGKGEIVVVPDMAQISIGVQTKNLDASGAQNENAKLMDQVIAALHKHAVAEKDIKTTGYSLYQTYDYDSDGKRSDPYYVSSNTVTVTLRDIDKVGTLIDATTTAGANSINNIRFMLEDDSEYYQEALKLAMENAKGKAEAILSTFDRSPGLPKSISESSSGGRLYLEYSPDKAMAESYSNVETPIEAGEITVSASVSVTYDY
ncbi:SIMPL domain-containing protein [Fusibacter tunisiensis]|uniref:Uncharacterized protein YggE n=1 Tax=Fusibacter tunisiensis TaxID=1008308 RepID=A0ABS2MN76_9FIRM|nr:SIMPL domain-containing protein [Fusibacter tunisiensis]MBM7560777.1 uncharacterized protein YggE [Fusibacter tunisiensis]